MFVGDLPAAWYECEIWGHEEFPCDLYYMDLDGSWGWALEAGLDYELDNNWLIGAQVFYISIETEADVEAGNTKVLSNLDVEINPWVYMISVGRKF